MAGFIPSKTLSTHMWNGRVIKDGFVLSSSVIPTALLMTANTWNAMVEEVPSRGQTMFSMKHGAIFFHQELILWNQLLHQTLSNTFISRE